MKPDIDAAHRFLADTGRVLDRRRFERLFLAGPAAPVRDAVAAYRTGGGGFGHALEPDGRGPGSQPLAIQLALQTLHEADAWDDAIVQGACRWLAANAPPEGGAVFVDPGVEGWPHAPWWVPEPGLPASLITTALLAGTLHGRRVRHPWLDRATEWVWGRLDDLGRAGPYDMRAVLYFLDRVPDRDRAASALESAAAVILDGGLVTLDPEAPGEIHTPLDFAPLPGSLGRRLFSAQVIDAHLDHLAAAQQPDGGWAFNWAAWSPAATADWRGGITVDVLALLRANGRG